MIRIFIGFDPRETVAYHVLCQSILARSSEPVSFTPLVLSNLKKELWRERHPLQSTDFSFSRFLTPSLCNFEGWALFMDCDMLCLDDIAKLWALRDDRYAVMCVQHQYEVRESTKFLGEKQTAYEKKNWSSVMLFNNARCRALTREYVNTATGLELHQFKWLESDEQIGALPQRWNDLVGYQLSNQPVGLAHYTLGGPYFSDYAQCEHADAWRSELRSTLVPTP
jgi:lipopolysaccharide biosynthesis glycosyltransferase